MHYTYVDIIYRYTYGIYSMHVLGCWPTSVKPIVTVTSIRSEGFMFSTCLMSGNGTDHLVVLSFAQQPQVKTSCARAPCCHGKTLDCGETGYDPKTGRVTGQDAVVWSVWNGVRVFSLEKCCRDWEVLYLCFWWVFLDRLILLVFIPNWLISMMPSCDCTLLTNGMRKSWDIKSRAHVFLPTCGVTWNSYRSSRAHREKNEKTISTGSWYLAIQKGNNGFREVMSVSRHFSVFWAVTVSLLCKMLHWDWRSQHHFRTGNFIFEVLLLLICCKPNKPELRRCVVLLQQTTSLLLVVWLPFFIFPYIGCLIIPIDELIFFRGVAQPPTSHCCWTPCCYLMLFVVTLWLQMIDSWTGLNVPLTSMVW